MTLENTIALLRAILNDVPVAITTGTELIRLVNEAWSRLAQSGAHTMSPEEITALVDEINSNSRAIQSLGQGA